MQKELRELLKCKNYPSRNAKKDGTCKWQEQCEKIGTEGCAVTVLKKILLPKTIDMTGSIREELSSKRFGKELISEEKVAELLKTKPIWDVTEEVYGVAFDHSDRSTWVFYSKVNRIRKKYNLPRVVPGAIVTGA